MSRRPTILLLLVTSVVQAAGVTIVGPTAPISTGHSVKAVLKVTGITDEELPKATFVCEPSRGAALEPVVGRDGAILLLFSSEDAGVFTITVGINVKHVEWRGQIEKGLAGATTAQIEPADLAILSQAVSKLAASYPAKSGTCVIEVARPVIPSPIPVPSPIPPAPPSPGPVTAFERAITTLTCEVLESGGTVVTAAAIAKGFAITANLVESRQVALDDAMPAVNLGMRNLFTKQGDADMWFAWRKTLGDALDKLRQDGSLATQDQYAALFREIARGMNTAIETHGAK